MRTTTKLSEAAIDCTRFDDEGSSYRTCGCLGIQYWAFDGAKIFINLIPTTYRRTATKTRHMAKWKRLRWKQKTPPAFTLCFASATLTNPIVACDCHYKDSTPFISPWMPSEKRNKTVLRASSPGGVRLRQNTTITIATHKPDFEGANLSKDRAWGPENQILGFLLSVREKQNAPTESNVEWGWR